MSDLVTGALLVDKPSEWTSHDVVGRVRRLAGTRRVGHTGTLDPFATGVLIVCVNGATRLSQYLVGCEKEYLATVRFGWATDTQDRTGERIGEATAPDLVSDDPERIRRVFEEMSGEQDQLPPMYSAKKVDGQALYKAARAGREVERKVVRIRAEMELLGVERSPEGFVDARARVVCSAGTYVRTLAHDAGARLGCGAHLAELRRTRVGRFGIDRAVTLEKLEGHVAEHIVPVEELAADLARIDASEGDAARVRNGMKLEIPPGCEAPDGADAAVFDESGALVAIARIDRGENKVRPRVVLAS